MLHLAVLGGALPRLLKRLREPDAGSASARLATEIEHVENSSLPWAVQARAAHARVTAVLAPLTAAERELLQELIPGDKGVGKPLELPSLRELVTAGYKQL